MDFETIGVAGLGLLGRGIAACFLGHGFRVVGFTRRESTHEEARRYIAQAMRDLVEHADFPAALVEEWPERYTAVGPKKGSGPICAKHPPGRSGKLDLTPFSACDFVVESVVEDMAAKQRVFDELEVVVRPEVPIASNTSALPVTKLQEGRKHPERFLGMHWAEPAHATRFMELIRGERTSDAAFEAVAGLARRIGKEPSLVQKDVPAFIVNRLGYALYREALHLLELGVGDVETIDRSCRNALGLWATICGPFRWIDISGGPALYARGIEGVLPSLSNATELTEQMKELVKTDARGITNGRGFYEYSEEEGHRWEELYLRHAWTVRKIQNDHFPIEP